MTCLQIWLLGTFRVCLDGEPVSDFSTNKVRGLLCYLAVEANRKHQREGLSEIFWPGRSPDRSRANLSQALFTLRRTLRDTGEISQFFHISRESIQFNRECVYCLDVTDFETGLQVLSNQVFGEATLAALEKTIALYRGDFLDDFSIPNSLDFEDWATLQRERLRRKLIHALDRLSNIYAQLDDYESALRHAWHQVELDPWREEAHVTVIRLLALNGQRSQALAQYETCRHMLAEEIGVEPLKETISLCEQIREGKFTEADGTLKRSFILPPPIISSSGKPLPGAVQPTFVAREQELAKMEAFLKEAISGEGCVVFVTGDAGSGKTALIREFCRRALIDNPNLLIASGKSTAYTGIGDPYTAFREIMALLSGDIETQWVAGAIDREVALRLWQALPIVLEVLVERAPDLINTFVNGAALLKRASVLIDYSDLSNVHHTWFRELKDLVTQKVDISGAYRLQQLALFQQYAKLLAGVAQNIPILLTLDDLQWADTGTLSLLFHLGKYIQGKHILIIGAYRPTEISRFHDGERHPLEPLVNEFQRNFGDILIRLGESRDRGFVEALIDSEPNRLPDSFREQLFLLTGGHPLFTIELLRGLQERGDLILEDQGLWVERGDLNWELLPPRIEGIIAERISQLPTEWQQLMRTASVQGESFIAEVVASLEGWEQEQIINILSGRLQETHHFVLAQRIETLGDSGVKLAVYQFKHILFQRYLYGSLDPVEKARLHQATGHALEQLYGSESDEVSVQLAHHFYKAEDFDKAATYRLEAGDRALQWSAIREAIIHLTQGLEALGRLKPTLAHLQCELNLQLSLGAAYKIAKGYAAPETGNAYHRANDLCNLLGATQQRFHVLLSLVAYNAMQPDLGYAMDLAEQMLVEAELGQDPILIALGHQTLGYVQTLLGQFASAHEHLNQMIVSYDREKYGYHAYAHGQDSGVTCLAWDAWVLFFLGYQDQALQRAEQAVLLAKDIDHPFSLTYAHNMAASYYVFRRDAVSAKKHAKVTLELAKEYGFAFYHVTAKFGLGWAQANSGEIAYGIENLLDCLAGYKEIGVGLFCRSILTSLAEIYGKDGQIGKGLETLERAAYIAPVGGERYWEAELYRVKGDLLRKAGFSLGDIEACYRQAIKIARQQGAKTLELRATTSLCSLLKDQDKPEAARERLKRNYQWFTEGLDTPDLRDAAILINELSRY